MARGWRSLQGYVCMHVPTVVFQGLEEGGSKAGRGFRKDGRLANV